MFRVDRKFFQTDEKGVIVYEKDKKMSSSCARNPENFKFFMLQCDLTATRLFATKLYTATFCYDAQPVIDGAKMTKALVTELGDVIGLYTPLSHERSYEGQYFDKIKHPRPQEPHKVQNFSLQHSLVMAGGMFLWDDKMPVKDYLLQNSYLEAIANAARNDFSVIDKIPTQIFVLRPDVFEAISTARYEHTSDRIDNGENPALVEAQFDKEDEKIDQLCSLYQDAAKYASTLKKHSKDNGRNKEK